MNLHYAIMSSYAQKSLMALYEKGVDFTPVKVNLASAEGIAEYRKIYPLGKIPLLTGDDGLFIPESTIIIEYLENEFAEQGTSLIPADKTAARRVRFKDRIADLYVNEPVILLYRNSVQPVEQQDQVAIAKAHETLAATFALLEPGLGKQEFMCGDAFSMADCAMFAPLFYAKNLHPYDDHPNLTAYFERLKQRPSAQKVLAELIPFLKSMSNT